MTNPRKALTLLAGVAMATALSACASTEHAAPPEPITPTERYGLEVKPQQQELRLAVHSNGVSPNQAQALGAFARQWAQSERGEIVLQSPSRSADPDGAYRTAAGARDVLMAQGIASDRIRLVGYDPAADAQAPVIVSYTRYSAQVPKCGQAWENITDTIENRPTDNFGCAVTANMAAQIGDPGDIVQPREMTPSDAARRQVVLDHYRKGEVTSSAKDLQADGSVSRTVP